MWFKNGLKAQKLLAQGNALGIIAVNKAPCKGKSFVYCLVLERASALSGRVGHTYESKVIQKIKLEQSWQEKT